LNIDRNALMLEGARSCWRCASGSTVSKSPWTSVNPWTSSNAVSPVGCWFARPDPNDLSQSKGSGVVNALKSMW